MRSTSAKAGRLGEIGELARLHGRELRAVARRLTRDHDDAADLLQDSLERAMRSAKALTTRRLLGWTVTVMRNLFVDQCRQRRVARDSLRNLHLLAPPLAGNAVAEDAPETLPTSVDSGCHEIATALAALDERFRVVLELYASGLSHLQIASALAIPKATVGTRLYRGRRKLRAALQAINRAS